MFRAGVAVAACKPQPAAGFSFKKESSIALLNENLVRSRGAWQRTWLLFTGYSS